MAGAEPLAAQRNVAAGTPDGVPAAVREQMRRQEPLVAAANVVRPAAEAAGGYSGIALEGATVVLYWKGAVPGPVSAAVTRARRAAPVEVRAARHSRQELRTAAQRIIDSPAARGTVQAVKFPVQGSGLEVEATAGATLPALPASGVPVTVVRRPAPDRKAAPTPAAAGRPAAKAAARAMATWVEPSRENDISPWWGGARMTDADASVANNGFWVSQGYHCTSGFPVRKVIGDAYWTGMLVPAHCGSPGHRMTDGNGTQINEHVNQCLCNQHGPSDLLILSVPDVEPYVYDGPQGSSRGKPLVGWDPIYPGETLCVSAGQTGVMCGVTVTNMTVTEAIWKVDSDGDGTGNIEGLVELRAPFTKRRLIASGDWGEGEFVGNAIYQGDDGSPVFALSGAGVKAKGILIDSEAVAGDFTGRLFVQPFSNARTVFASYVDLQPLTPEYAP
jgi:hypothetical protein